MKTIALTLINCISPIITCELPLPISECTCSQSHSYMCNIGIGISSWISIVYILDGAGVVYPRSIFHSFFDVKLVYATIHGNCKFKVLLWYIYSRYYHFLLRRYISKIPLSMRTEFILFYKNKILFKIKIRVIKLLIITLHKFQ